MELMSRVVIGNVFRALNGFFWRSKFNFAFFSIFHVQYLPWQALHGTRHTHLLKTWRSSYHSVSNLQFGCTTKKYNSISCPRFVFFSLRLFFTEEAWLQGATLAGWNAESVFHQIYSLSSWQAWGNKPDYRLPMHLTNHWSTVVKKWRGPVFSNIQKIWIRCKPLKPW